MTTITNLQRRLNAHGWYTAPIDGDYGPLTRKAIMTALTEPTDAPASAVDISHAASALKVPEAVVRAVREVESSGDPFVNGRPTILFEPHRFSRATQGRFDKRHPKVSYPTWDAKKYPASQDGRYDQLLEAVGLDVDAGFASASWGAFQILGENFGICGYPDPWAFALSQAQSEGDQLLAFVSFVRGRGLDVPLRRRDWAAFARGYNGTAYKLNRYDQRLAAAYARYAK